MDPLIKVVVATIIGLILATLVAVGLLIGAGHAHAGMTSSHTFDAVHYVERGRHGDRK